MKYRLAAAAVLVTASLAMASCSQTGGNGSSVSATVPALADISKLVPSVQAQITAQHDALAKTLALSTATIVDKANAHGELGRLYMAAQLPDAAQAAFTAAQTVDPSDFRWPYFLAQLAKSQGDLPKATSLFDRVLQLKPDDTDTLVWLGEVHLTAGHAELAAPLFARVLELEPNSVSARFGAGRAALAQGDNQKAASMLEEALRLNPKATAVHYPLSQAYAALGDQAKASEHLRLRRDGRIAPRDTLMVELDSLLQSPQSYESQGIRKLDDEDFAAAAELFRKGLALAPDTAALHHRLATALSLMKDEAGARTEFETAIRLSPEYFPAQYSLGVMLQSEGRQAEAIEHFEAAIKARPTYTDARLRLASSLRRMNRLPDALAAYEQALASAPDNTEATMGRVMVLSRLGKDREALTVLQEAQRASGGALVFTHGLARLMASSPDARVRNGRASMDLVQQMLQRGRTLELGETYAMALAELGQFREARALQGDLIAAATRAGLVPMVSRLKARLQLYDRADPCRTPWSPEEMP